MKVNILILIMIVVITIFIYLTRKIREGVFMTVYTMTPRVKETTLSDIAQMWWQPVAYIRNV